VFANSIVFPVSPAWSVTLNGPVSYPLIAGGKVFVTTAGIGTGYGTQLFALDEQTGNVVWGPVAITGTYNWSGLAYDQGMVFVINYDGLLQSFNAATGVAGWSTQLPGQSAFSSPPTAVNGIVYVGGAGSGGTVYAADESNGSVLWTSSVMNGDHSSPAVSSDGVFVSYPCQVYKFDPITGSSLWHYSGPCEGGGGKTPAYANGLLYVRDPGEGSDKIFDASIGTMVGTFTATPIPALSAQTGFFQSAGTLQGIDLTTHNVLWSFTGDGFLVSAPIVINQTVFVGSSSGNVYAVDSTTGAKMWSGAAGSTISGPDEQNVSQPLTGLGAGEGYLIVPAGSVLTAWKLF
jgi:outer membrane protein assembly factor BamB